MECQHPDEMHRPNAEPETEGTGAHPTEARDPFGILEPTANIERDEGREDGDGDG